MEKTASVLVDCLPCSAQLLIMFINKIYLCGKWQVRSKDHFPEQTFLSQCCVSNE